LGWRERGKWLPRPAAARAGAAAVKATGRRRKRKVRVPSPNSLLPVVRLVLLLHQNIELLIASNPVLVGVVFFFLTSLHVK
jgi:hypothetical protein